MIILNIQINMNSKLDIDAIQKDYWNEYTIQTNLIGKHIHS